MIVFNGKYTWNGKSDTGQKPVSWWPGSQYLIIVDISTEKTDVVMLKPILVLASDTKELYSIHKRYQDLIIGVCREFNLEVQKVLWVRYNRDGKNEMKVAILKWVAGKGPYKVFDLKWRKVMANERKLVDAVVLPLSLSRRSSKCN
ncbi:MAG: hypothetical protein B6240_10595 [Desulfobacteraceae bacterium 4572_87]|nr:MAG: hypothetical protein B6240_10595 [Desulfobacteraceae bacterium 4572_87]